MGSLRAVIRDSRKRLTLEAEHHQSQIYDHIQLYGLSNQPALIYSSAPNGANEPRSNSMTVESLEYDCIISLTSKLTSSNLSIPKRRTAALDLERRLSNYDIRRQLASEVSPGKGVDDISLAARRCRALSILWSNALSRCIYMTKEIFNNSKAKCTIEDLRLPDKILRAASQPDDAFDSNGLGIPKLSKKSVRSALKYCLEILENEAKIPAGGEQKMIDMLAFLCSMDEYVGCFKYNVDFQKTLSEIFHHMGKHMDHQQNDSGGRIIFESATKAFCNFFGTCSRLGIEVHVFLSDSLEIISDWCELIMENRRLSSSSSIHQNLFNALASMLHSHPADSIGPMMRYGQQLLRCCKKAYPKAHGLHKDALNRYLLSHLFVAQLAGKIQGRLDGDLGDLGSATLTERQILELLDLCIDDVVKGFEKGTNIAAMSRIRRQKNSNRGIWHPLDDRQQLQLELVARLLACAQRLYIAREGWDVLENRDDTLEALLKVPGPDKDEEWIDSESFEIPEISVDIIAKSPWINLVLRKLVSSKYRILSDDPDGVETKEASPSLVSSIRDTPSSLLLYLLKQDDVNESPIPHLAIIGACAELFPAGECWSSSASENWHRFIPKEKAKDEVIWCHGSSISDLTCLLSILLKLLKEHGHPDSDPNTQYWILLILTKLTETTAVMFHQTKNDSCHLLPLIMKWRAVWKTLLRLDLRYVSYTNFLGENSLGEIFVILLTEIIARKCTETFLKISQPTECRESSFIYQHQRQIWGFLLTEPTAFRLIGSRAQFELISTISKFAGIADEQDGGTERSLRRHLFRLSLQSITDVLTKGRESDLQYSCKDELIRAIASCIVCLVTGNDPSLSRLSATDLRFFLTASDGESSAQNNNEMIQQKHQKSFCEVCLNILWGTRDVRRQDPNLSFFAFYGSEFDSTHLVARRVRCHLKEEDAKWGNHTVDFISDHHSEDLRRYALEFLDEEIVCRLKLPETAVGFNNNTHSKRSQTGVIKLILSLRIAQNTLETDLLAQIPHIISFFVDSVSYLATNPSEPTEYLEIASDLVHISQALVEISSCYPSGIDLTERMKIPMGNCQCMLKRYSDCLHSDDFNLTAESPAEKTNGVSSRNSNGDDFDFDYTEETCSPKCSVDSDNSYSHTKRGIREGDEYNENRSKRRKITSSILPPPNGKCAKLIGCLLLSLAPSTSNSRLVCESILGTFIDADPETVKGDMDLRMATTAISLLSMKEVLLNDMAKRTILSMGGSGNLSPIGMMCQVIDVLRKSVEPSSRLFMYGNYDCAEAAVEMFKLDLQLTVGEARMIVESIGNEEGIRGRPILRAQRVKAATLAFENGSDDFHEIFDTFFHNSIVKVGFDDTNFFVRRLASIAAAAASYKLDEKRILDCVNHRIATIFKGSTAQDIIEKFTDWYITNGLSSTEEEDRSKMEACDSLEIMESDAIFSRALLAGSTPNIATYRMLLHETLKIPVFRPDLEFVCYRALEKIACMRGYSSVRELVDLESEALLVDWFQKIKQTNTGEESLIFPPTLTSPRSFWFVMTFGQYNFFSQSKYSPDPNPESICFRKSSAMNFVWRYRSFIVPYTLVESHDAISNIENPTSIVEHIANQQGFRIVLENLESNKNDDRESIIRLLRRHVVDIQAFSILLNHSDDVLEKEIGRNILQILVQTISPETVESKTKKALSLIIRRIFYLSGAAKSFYGVIPNSKFVHFKAITDLTDTPNQPRNGSGDSFIDACTSLTELTIYAYNKLVRSDYSNHQCDAWSRFVLLGEFLMNQLKQGGGEQVQLGFFLHVLNDIVLKPSLQNIRPKVLELMIEIVKECGRLNETELDSEVAPIINRVICVCFHIHEESQQTLLRKRRQKLKNREIDFRRSGGFQFHIKHNWSIQNDHTTGDFHFEQATERGASTRLLHDCLVNTYEIIRWMTVNSEKVRLDPCVFMGLANTTEVEYSDLHALSESDEKYCVQNLAQNLNLRGNDKCFHNYISGLKCRTTMSNFLVSTKVSHSNFNHLFDMRATIDERLICSELWQISKLLGETELEEEITSDLKYLYNYLCRTSTTSRSKNVRFASSRCIALLKPRIMIDTFGMDSKSGSNSTHGNFLLNLRAKAMDCLAQCLKSSAKDVAMTAVTTLGAVLSDDACKNACSIISIESRTLMKPFVNRERYSTTNNAILSKDQVKVLMKRAGVVNGDLSTGMWCWDRQLWNFDKARDFEFEDWICLITSSIIVCCFNRQANERSNDKVTDDSYFFWSCQRIANLDHEFASTIFPSLILTLLLSGEGGNSKKEKLDNVNNLITQSFESFLVSGIHRQDPTATVLESDFTHKALSIIIDTLDVLRRFSQGSFLSLNHKPIRTHLKKKTLKKTRTSDRKVGSDSIVSWKGIPFGVILHLDGTIVAEACIEVRRFASALFFLDIFFNSQYGKSSGLFEQLNNSASCVDLVGEYNGTPYISGMDHVSKLTRPNDKDLRNTTIKAISLTSRCYKELGEFDLMRAADIQLSSLKFIDDSNNLALDLDRLRGNSSLDTLQMLSFHSSQAYAIDNRLFLSVIDSMDDLGLEGFITTYIEGVLAQNKELREKVDAGRLREKWFESNLKTNNWNMRTGGLSNHRNHDSALAASSGILTNNASPSNQGFFELISEALNSFSNSDKNSSKLFLSRARSRVIDSLSNIAGEQLSSMRFIEIVDKFRALKDIDSLVEADFNLSRFDFDQVELLDISLRMRQITLTALFSRHPEDPKILLALKDHLWESCNAAVDRGRLQIAENALSELRFLLSVSTENNTLNEVLRVRFEEAKILECRGDFNGAIQKMKQLTRYLCDDDNSNRFYKSLLTDAQILCGSWMTKYKTQQSKVILESYLNPAAVRAKSIFDEDSTKANADRAAKVSIKLGHVLANLHDDLLLRIQSNDWKETDTRLEQQHQQYLDLEERRRELSATIQRCRKSASQPVKEREARRQLGEIEKLEKEYLEMNKEREGIKTSIPCYLNHALKAFLSALSMAGTSANDLSSHVSRMISLWFSSQSRVGSGPNTNTVMQDGMCHVPSFRFVALTNQLLSRIETPEVRDDQTFQKVLQNLILRMCRDHPYHCIAPLIALTNGEIDTKTQGAQHIVEKLGKSSMGYVRGLLESYIVLTSAYNDLAHASTKKFEESRQRKKQKIKFSEISRCFTGKPLDRCLGRLSYVPTIVTSPPILRPGKDYGDGKEDPIGGERIAGFESDFAITESGINRPKIVMCIGTRGGSFRQLVKGEDDIRQDAIMSQVFTYVNSLMKRRINSTEDPNRSKSVAKRTRHKLQMITYTILPLSPSSGVLEWVEGTQPMMSFLNDQFGRVGSHSRYFPEEWSGDQCRFTLQQCGKSRDEKRNAFDEICSRYSPSFRFFFLERFGNCMESWHIAKMNFTRSVAVNSIVGHILGIGDRHLGNILIDQGTGEVVHIDFGFVFEQGKLLPIPECVPFRLTRNIIDGMGPCGIDGLFVNVAEETMSVLRKHDQELLAILSAVVADPLYKWNVNSSVARRRQLDEERESNYSVDERVRDSLGADRPQNTAKIMNKIKEKLQGYEDSTSGEQQGVEGQVQFLINSARDPNNLCSLFAGWAPWD